MARKSKTMKRKRGGANWWDSLMGKKSQDQSPSSPSSSPSSPSYSPSSPSYSPSSYPSSNVYSQAPPATDYSQPPSGYSGGRRKRKKRSYKGGYTASSSTSTLKYASVGGRSRKRSRRSKR